MPTSSARRAASPPRNLCVAGSAARGGAHVLREVAGRSRPPPTAAAARSLLICAGMRGIALSTCVLASTLGAACGDDIEAHPVQPAGWKDAVSLPEAIDLDPSPDVVEINLTARVAQLEIKPGLLTPAWTYDGSVPGPLIRARAGNRVIVHFTNNLPDETTIHWHGVRLTADMDGVPGHSQPPVPPGGTFDYSFVVPDASLFWYH